MQTRSPEATAPGLARASALLLALWVLTGVTVGSARAQGGGLPDTRGLIARLLPAPPGAHDSLFVGSGSGGRGNEVAVSLGLTNNIALTALQADIRFDPAVVNVAGAVSAGRAGGMSLAYSVLHQDTLRVLLYFTTLDSIPAGSGAIAQVSFLLLGAPGSATSLLPANVTAVDPRAESVPVTSTGGQISVTSGGGPEVTVIAPNGGESWTSGTTQSINWVAADARPLTLTLEYSSNSGSTWNAIASGVANSPPYSWVVPDAGTSQARVRVTASDGSLQAWDISDGDFNIISANPLTLYLSVLKNPARARTIQIFCTADRTLDAPPAVYVGQARIVMTRMTGINIFQGNASVGENATSVVVTATARSGSAVSSTRTTVNF